eukprot:2091707-Ditylum_brightwellii.AAC.1
MVETVFSAVQAVMSTCKGGYAGLYLINGVGLVGFHDPHGICPLVFGTCKSSLATPVSTVPAMPAKMNNAKGCLDYVVSSESVTIDTLGFNLVCNVKAGEEILINMHTSNCYT